MKPLAQRVMCISLCRCSGIGLWSWIWSPCVSTATSECQTSSRDACPNKTPKTRGRRRCPSVCDVSPQRSVLSLVSLLRPASQHKHTNKTHFSSSTGGWCSLGAVNVHIQIVKCKTNVSHFIRLWKRENHRIHLVLKVNRSYFPNDDMIIFSARTLSIPPFLSLYIHWALVWFLATPCFFLQNCLDSRFHKVLEIPQMFGSILTWIPKMRSADCRSLKFSVWDDVSFVTCVIWR